MNQYWQEIKKEFHKSSCTDIFDFLSVNYIPPQKINEPQETGERIDKALTNYLKNKTQEELDELIEKYKSPPSEQKFWSLEYTLQTPVTTTDEEVFDKFVEWVDFNGWSVSGGMTEVNENGEFIN